jgi:hypothetical protein
VLVQELEGSFAVDGVGADEPFDLAAVKKRPNKSLTFDQYR